MRIVQTVTPKKSDWTIQRLHHEDGRIRFHTGEHISPYGWKHRAETLAGGGLRYEGMRVEDVANAVVEAAFWLDGKHLVCAETGHVYQVSQSTLYDILQAIVDGDLATDGERITGRFTFKRFSGKIWLSAAPRDKKAARKTRFGSADGARDLSDFVKTLSGEG